MRLFFERFLRARNQALTDTQTGIPIGMIAHAARLAQHQSSTRGIARGRLASIVAHDQAMTAMTFSTGIVWIHAAGDDLLVPRLIPGIPENTPLHPVGAFAVATARVPPLFRAEIA